MWVVKLGGSLLGTPQLQEWLDMLVAQGDGRIIIVPGGGAFADTVRAQQFIGGYDDTAAHRMALLAMEQYGLALQSLQPALVTASSELEIAERSWQHRAIVWMPSAMVCANKQIPHSWRVTSDSLAAWLAAKLGADLLCLIKHLDQSHAVASLSRWMETGVLDEAFGEFSAHLTCPIHVMDKSDIVGFRRLLAATPRSRLA